METSEDDKIIHLRSSSLYFTVSFVNCVRILTHILQVLSLTWAFTILFSFTVLVPLTRSVYKPATRILSLQSEIEKRRNNQQDNNCPPTNPPSSPDSMSHLILKHDPATQETAAEELWTHFPSQREDPFSSTDGKTNGMTRGCQDKEGERGQTAASRHLSWETSTTQQQCKMGKKAVSYFVRTHCVWMAKEINCPTKSGLHKADWTATINRSKDTIWSPVKAAVHAPVMSVITQNAIKLTNVSLPLSDQWLDRVPLYPASN